MSKNHQTVDATAVKRIIESGLSIRDLAKEFGIRANTIGHWIRTDTAPYWTRCAVEALERRRGKNSKHLFVGELPSAEALGVVATVIKSLGGDIHLRLSR